MLLQACNVANIITNYYKLLAEVRVHEPWWAQYKPLGWELGLKNFIQVSDDELF